MTGAAGQQRISTEFIADFDIALPKITEQTKIVKYLNGYKSKTKKLSEIIFKQISLLKEYRTRLISDSVTGGIDIRNWEQNTCSEDK